MEILKDFNIVDGLAFLSYWITIAIVAFVSLSKVISTLENKKANRLIDSILGVLYFAENIIEKMGVVIETVRKEKEKLEEAKKKRQDKKEKEEDEKFNSNQ